MKRQENKNLFYIFLKENSGSVLFFLLVCGAFLTVFSLYQLNMEPFFYAAVLCLFVGGIALCLRFLRFYKRIKDLRSLTALPEPDWSTLKEPGTLTEAEYQKIIRRMDEQYRALYDRLLNDRAENLHYYMTWMHQIKTPIAAMQMILQSEDTEEHRELSAELFRIEQYAEMALQYIRLDSPSHDFVFQEYDLDPLIRQAVRKYAPQFIRKKIRLNYEPVSMTVLTDEKWLSFIIEQLLSNAVKYTYRGSVTIRILPGQVLSIEDTGIGIAPEDLPRIFEKGFTGYNGRSDKKSTGLGLYLCRQAADKLSVKLTADSTPGKGSVFKLYLPQNKLEAE